MFKKLNLKRNLLLISIPVLIIVSAIALYTNGIFYFSEFKPSVVIKYSSDDAAKLKELLDKSTQLNNVSSVDRVNNVIEIEGVSLENVKSTVSELTKDYSAVTYTIKEVSSLKKGSLIALIGGIYVLLLAGAAIHFYFVSSKGGELKIILSTYLILAVNLTIATFVSLGLLSLISRFYKIESLDLLFILIAAFINYIFFYLAAEHIYEITNFQSLGNNFRLFIVNRIKPILFATVILILVPAIGLGTSFVIHGVLLFGFILIFFLQFYWHSYLMEDWHNLRFSFSDRLSTLGRYKKKKPQQVVVSTSKKKDKKKKKKK